MLVVSTESYCDARINEHKQYEDSDSAIYITQIFSSYSHVLRLHYTYKCANVLDIAVYSKNRINPLNPELNLICYLLALLGAHHFLYLSRIRVKLLTFRLLMSYIYMDHPFLMFLDHTQRRSTVGRTPLDE